jgi:hypothetical protein
VAVQKHHGRIVDNWLKITHFLGPDRVARLASAQRKGLRPSHSARILQEVLEISAPPPTRRRRTGPVARRFGVLGDPKLAGLVGVIGLIATLIGVGIAFLSWRGDEQQRGGDAAPTTAGPPATVNALAPASPSATASALAATDELTPEAKSSGVCTWVVDWPEVGVYEDPIQTSAKLPKLVHGERFSNDCAIITGNDEERYVKYATTRARDDIAWVREKALFRR